MQKCSNTHFLKVYMKNETKKQFFLNILIILNYFKKIFNYYKKLVALLATPSLCKQIS